MNNCDNNSSELIQTEDANSVGLDEDQQFNFQQNQKNEELADLILEKLLSNDSIAELLSNTKDLKNRSERSSNYNIKGQRGRKKTRNGRPIIFLDYVSYDDHLKKLDSRFDYANIYLDVVEVMNNELYEDAFNRDFPSSSKFILSGLLWEINLTLLNRIERFMITLALKPLPAFVEEGINVNRKPTSIGKEFIYLLSKSHTISQFDHEYLTGNVKILVEFLENNQLSSQRYAFNLSRDITNESLRDLNYLLNKLYVSLMQGRYDKANLGIARNWYIDRMGTQFRDFKELKKLMAGIPSWVKRIKAPLVPHLHKDIAIFRFQIEIFQENNISLRYKEFSEFFTSLIKKAKLATKLPGFLQYVNAWKEFDDGVLQCDFTIFFDANELSESDLVNLSCFFKVKHQLIDIAESMKELKQEGGLKPFANYEIIIRQIPIISTISDEEVWLLERGSARWKDVDNKLIPYFFMVANSEREYTDDVKNRAGGGRDRTKKPEEESKDKKSDAVDPKKTESSTKS